MRLRGKISWSPSHGWVESLLLPRERRDASWDEYARKTLALLQSVRHPNVARLIAHGRHADGYFLTYEHVPGPTVYDVRHQAGVPRALPIELGIYVGVAAARGLHAVHAACASPAELRRVLSVDALSLEIGFEEGGGAKLLGLGVERAPYDRAGCLRPEVRAMAPEVARGHDADARADVFLLGAWLFELLSGTRMFSASADYDLLMQIVEGYRPDFAAAMPRVPKELREILARATAHHPEDRHRTADELAEELIPWADGFGGLDAAVALSRMGLSPRR